MQNVMAGLLALTPEQMAACSPEVQKARAFLAEQVAGIKDPALQKHLTEMFERPQPCLPDGRKEQKALYQRLIKAGYLESDITFAQFIPASDEYFIPPVWAAAGSHYRGHHAYPGGLVVHTAKNLRIALHNARLYADMYGLPFERDLLVFAQTTHDLAKTWLLPWQADGSCLAQYRLAGAGAHHVFGLAESIRRQIAPAAVWAQAATHINPEGKRGRAKLAAFLRAACLIADADPASYGLCDAESELLPENRRVEYWFSYISDHMVIFAIMATWRAVSRLKELAANVYGFDAAQLAGRAFNQFRNYLFCQLGLRGLLNAAATDDLSALAAKAAPLLAKLPTIDR
jgi:hypothetical protein